MLTRSPSLAILSRLCFFLLCFVHIVLGQTPGHEIPGHRNDERPSVKGPDANNGLVCTPFGGCEPCPPDAINQPFCRPFGNRRLMHCVNVTDSSSRPPGPHNPHIPPKPSHDSPLHPGDETLAWESCGRIVEKERADFFEFVAVNVVFAIIALGVLFFRSRRMQLMQARQLAARIGLLQDDGLRRNPRL